MDIELGILVEQLALSLAADKLDEQSVNLV